MSDLNCLRISRPDGKLQHRAARKSSISASVFSAFWALADGFAVCGLTIVCDAVYEAILHGKALWSSLPLGDGLTLATIFVAISFAYGDYKFERMVDAHNNVPRSFQIWLFSVLFFTWIAFLSKSSADISRGSTIMLFLSGWLIIHRLHNTTAKLLTSAIAKKYVTFQRAYLIAPGSDGKIEQLVAQFARSGVSIVGANALEKYSPGKSGRTDIPGTSIVRDVRACLQNTEVDAIYLFLPWENWNFVTRITAALQDLPLPVYLFAEPKYTPVLNSASSRIGGELAFVVERGPLTTWERCVKRAVDIAISVLGIVLLSPILVSAAVAIFVTTGRPVIFRQARRGFGGKPFNIYKFRSMSVAENGSDIRQVERNDQRVTAVGRVLRRTSIDELPQLFNVLFGHMSIVGPRPHAVAHDNRYDSEIATYAFRQHVKPGITGWAQVNGHRGETTQVRQMEARVERDLWYINNWSFQLDIHIILKTAATVLFDRSVY